MPTTQPSPSWLGGGQYGEVASTSDERPSLPWRHDAPVTLAANRHITTSPPPSLALRCPLMDGMTALRTLVRCCQLLLELQALPPGTLPDDIDDAIEDLLAPGYRERLTAAYLASLPTGDLTH
jgi:hypothetical protein